MFSMCQAVTQRDKLPKTSLFTKEDYVYFTKRKEENRTK